MLGEFFVEVCGEFLKDVVIFPIAYVSGKLVVWLFTFGTLHTTFDDPNVRPIGKKKKKPPPRRYEVTFVRNGNRFLIPQMTALVGMVAWGIAIAVIVVR